MRANAYTNVYDHLVIGAGSAGCVVAARLAQAGRRVALIEAGPLEEHNEDILNLGHWSKLIGGPLDYDFRIEPQPRGNHATRHPRGRVLGGTGSLNTCIAFIPPERDFQRWEAAGAAGWSAAEVAPHFERALATLGVEPASMANPLGAAFVAAAEAAGVPRVSFAGARWRQGVGPVSFNRRGDRRRSTAIAYLLPLAQWRAAGRLHLQPETTVQRLLIEKGRVVGAATDAGEYFAEARSSSAPALSIRRNCCCYPGSAPRMNCVAWESRRARTSRVWGRTCRTTRRRRSAGRRRKRRRRMRCASGALASSRRAARAAKRR